MEAAVKRQNALHHRVMTLARKSHVLVDPISQRGGAGGGGTGHLYASSGMSNTTSSSITREEEALRARLEACEAELENAGGGVSANGNGNGRMRARVNELWALVGSVKAKREALLRQGQRPRGVEWAVVDERGVELVAQVSLLIILVGSLEKLRILTVLTPGSSHLRRFSRNSKPASNTSSQLSKKTQERWI